MATLLEKLSRLNRPERLITVKSLNGEQEVACYYIRPTLAEDQVLQKQMTEEYEAILKGLKTAPSEQVASVYDRLVKQFLEAKIDVPANYIIKADLGRIRPEVIREIGIEPPAVLKEDASDEEKAAFKKEDEEFLEVFRPAIDKKIDSIRDTLKAEGHEALANRAAQAECENRAAGRAMEAHRLSLVAASIFDKEEKEDKVAYVKAFQSPEQVAKELDADTIITLANMISEELEKVRQLPLNSVAKK